jgi:DNA primase
LLNFTVPVKGFRLGWFPGEKGKNSKFRPRESWGLPTVIKESNGRKKMLWIPRGLVIPCFKAGQIYRIRIRRPAEDLTPAMNSKYYIVPGSGMEAMGMNPDRKAFVVVESELDGILVTRKWQVYHRLSPWTTTGNTKSRKGFIPFRNSKCFWSNIP